MNGDVYIKAQQVWILIVELGLIMKVYLALFLLFTSSPLLAATGTTAIGMIISVVFVCVMLVVFLLVVTEFGGKKKKASEVDEQENSNDSEPQ